MDRQVDRKNKERVLKFCRKLGSDALNVKVLDLDYIENKFKGVFSPFSNPFPNPAGQC